MSRRHQRRVSALGVAGQHLRQRHRRRRGTASEATGQCSVNFTSNTTGTVTGNASATVTLVTPQGNIDMPVSTDRRRQPNPGNSRQALRRRQPVLAEGGRERGAPGRRDLRGLPDPRPPRHRHRSRRVRDGARQHGSGHRSEPTAQFLLIDLKLGRYTIEETVAAAGYSLISHVEVVFIGGSGIRRTDVPPDENLLDIVVDYIWVNGRRSCLVIIDEDTVDNGYPPFRRQPPGIGSTPDWLVNDNDPIKGVPTEHGNPPLNWNDFFPGRRRAAARRPGGRRGLVRVAPGDRLRAGGSPRASRFNDLDGNVIANSDDWIAAFANGTLPQDKLDKMRDVMPLRNQELVQLVGRTCVAVVYDSDISMDYEPHLCQPAGSALRLVLLHRAGGRGAGLHPRVQSEHRPLRPVAARSRSPLAWSQLFEVTVRDHEPDAIEITCAEYDAGLLTVWGTSDFAPGAVMTVSVDETEIAQEPRRAEPFLLEETMTFNASRGALRVRAPHGSESRRAAGDDLDRRRRCLHGGDLGRPCGSGEVTRRFLRGAPVGRLVFFRG